MWVALDWLYAKLDCVEYEMWCRSGKYNGRLEKQNCAKDFLTSVRGTGRNLIHLLQCICGNMFSENILLMAAFAFY